MRRLGDVRRSIVRLLRDYVAVAGDRERRPPILRALAAEIVEFRQHFVTPDGETDWTGRSWAYRTAIREAYSEAGIPSSEVGALQSAIRFHIATLLRERLSAADLEALGLALEPPNVRAASRRADRSLALRALTGGDPDGFEGDALRALQGAATLSGLARRRLADLPAEEREEAVSAARRCERTAREIRRVLEAG